MKRATMIILDSVGIGHAPDEKQFGDVGVHTLCHALKDSDIKLPNLTALGLGNIEGVSCMKEHQEPMAIFGRLYPLSQGKDTTIGHWEIAGLQVDEPLPTYPDGFPNEVMDAFEKAIGRETLVNKPYSGTVVLDEYGQEHMETGKPIIYTSNDSVFQIAAHEEVIPLDELYEMCEKAREILTGEHAVARVIARPFVGEPGDFTRTANRRDYSLSPFSETILDELKAASYDVIAIGKIEDIYNGSGVTESMHTSSNLDGIEKTIERMKQPYHGLIFTNLVDFDAKFGHRRDPKGYANALKEFDDHLPTIIQSLGEEDLLIITADHGNDPLYQGTDHTREMVPLLIYGPKIKARSFGTKAGFFNIANTLADFFDIETASKGESLL